MRPFLVILFATLLTPGGALAARGETAFLPAHELLATSTALGNAYTAGASVVVTSPVSADLTVVGGAVVSAGSVAGDALFVGGSVSSRAPVKGDLRAAGGTIILNEAVAGDVVALGYRVDEVGRAGGSVFVVAANASLMNGAGGPVTVYGNNVFLAGDFARDVRIVAGGSVTFGKDTTIRGRLSYEAPEPARNLDSVAVLGGVEYASASYLPDAGTSRALALASIGVFLLVRILGALILAGLLTGLFPGLARTITDKVSKGRLRSLLLTTLLGVAALIAAPIIIVLTAVTFVGFGVALFLGVAYALLVILAAMYAGILLGTLCVRRLSRRQNVLWRDGVLGMLGLSLVALVPIVGGLLVGVLTAFTAGTLLTLFFGFAFPHGESESEEV
ncbi:MAG: hypothetical protein WC030_00640 [Candidatus Paceibacterota bacterium]